jgi:dTDP-4-dehydrorhamnose 3,5-epimerase
LKILSTPISDLMVAKTSPITDARGAFSRLYCENELAPLIGNRRIIQVNHSRSAKVGSLRGMHFQKSPHAEMKFVRCIKGEVWDVAVDLRKGSSTFLHWHAAKLSSSNMYMMVIPEGFAHGFQVLEAESELLYLHTAPFFPEAEGGLHYRDPLLAIDWPLPVTDLSFRDDKRAYIKEDFHGITL